MHFSMFNNRATSEMLSITGIMALFSYIELKFGAIEWAVNEIINIAPGLNRYLIAFAGSMWAGLLVYSYFKHNQSQLAVRARKFLEDKLEKQKLANSVTGLPNRDGLEQIVNDTTILLEYPYWAFLGVEIANISSIRNVHGKDAVANFERAMAGTLAEIMSGEEFAAHDDQSIFYVFCAGEADDEVMFRVDQIIEKLSSLSEFKLGNGRGTLDIQVQLKFAIVQRSKVDRAIIRPERGSIARRIGFLFQQSKSQVSGSVMIYDSQFEMMLRRRAMIEVKLQKAIDAGEIVPYFQPFVEMKTNKVVGFEVLARWQHPVEGEIGPWEFVQIAEEQGLLAPLTASLVRQACKFAVHWPDHVMLAINISPTDLHNDKLITRLIDTIHDVGLDPARFEIEITENALIEEASNVSHAMSLLKEQGISISIDDFGTGYSSLHHLRLLPFDKIKIDQSFIKDVASNPESRAIVKSVIALGHSLGLPTIAEGIDLVGNRDVLEELGCTMGQGYLFAKPLASDEILDFLAKHDRPEEELLKVVA